MWACIQQDMQNPSCPIIHVYSCVCFLYSLLWSDFGASWRSLDKGMLGCWVILKLCPFKQDSCRCSQPAWTNLSPVSPKYYSRIPARSHVLHLCFIAKACSTTPCGMCKTLHAAVHSLILQFLVVKNWKNAISGNGALLLLSCIILECDPRTLQGNHPFAFPRLQNSLSLNQRLQLTFFWNILPHLMFFKRTSMRSVARKAASTLC